MSTIVSFSDLKNILDLNKANIADYPQLDAVSTSVHSAIENYIGKKISAIEKLTEFGFNEVHGKDIDLKNLPLSSIASIKLDGVLTTDFEIRPYGVELGALFKGKWEVVSKGGYKEIPDDIYRAELMQIVYEYQNINNLATKAITNDSGGTQTNEGFALLKEVTRLLLPYKHVTKFGF